MDFEFLYIIYECEFILFFFEVIKKEILEKFCIKCYNFLIFYIFQVIVVYSLVYVLFLQFRNMYIIDVIKFNVVKKLSLFNILIFDRLNKKMYIIIIEYILNFRLDVKVYIMQCKKVFQIQLKY